MRNGVSVATFKSIFDNKPKMIEFRDFDHLESTLYKMSERPLPTKKDAFLISPASYKEGTTRANRNVTHWGGWCCIDVDDYTFEGDLKDAIRSCTRNWHVVCYSTASSTEHNPKFRLVFRLSEEVQDAQIPALNSAIQKVVGHIGDEQTKDLSRMYYIPANYAGAYNFIFTLPGDPIDVNALIREFPYAQKANLNNFFDRLPEDVQKQIVEHRKSKMEKTDVHWTSYRDCPFFPRNLESEYRSISNTGWYHKMFQIMVALAGNAVKREYPITSAEISQLCREFDAETGNWYANRPMDTEADRAIEYVYKNI